MKEVDSYTLIILQHQFGHGLMNDQEEYILLRRLLTCANHPSLTAGHRLLYFHWLQHFPENKPAAVSSRDSNLPSILNDSLYPAFFPQIFDGQDTTMLKLNILSQCYTPQEIQDSAASTLFGCLLPLQKSIHYGIPGRPARTLYRAMFKYYQRHHKTMLQQDIYKCLLNIVIEHSKFAPHTINFIECVRKVTPDSKFPVEFLQELTTNLMMLQPSGIHDDLEFNLMILERAAQETQISPKASLQYLHTLLHSTSLGSEGNWLLGNAILSVCHSIMRFHDTDDIFKELGDLLFVMFTDYQDLDIRDRARFYYAMLTNLSSEKISNILSSTGTDPTQSVTRLVTGGAQFTIAPPVMHLQESILKLTRISRKIQTEEIAYDTFDQYLKTVRTAKSKPVIQMDYFLHYDKEVSVPVEMEKLYALAVHIETPTNYKHIQDLSLVSLFKDTSGKPQVGCQQITLNFCPLQPIPAQMPVSIVFSNSESQTCACHPDALEVNFGDIFLPLPVVQDKKVTVFTALWDYVHEEQEDSTNTTCAESVCSLLCSWQQISDIVNRHLKDYVVPSHNKDTIHIGIFLPPSWHLLFKVTPNQERVVVSIATDNWTILPLVNEYLLEVEKDATR
ncbi:AP-5 complex subunit beta-1-like [Amphiura filiformis]|uniref:AP-5 complex subunit beta-1-like n=1 Tax=Amphiura filiformis TaxID=82378 RepID=UPI003B20DA46